MSTVGRRERARHQIRDEGDETHKNELKNEKIIGYYIRFRLKFTDECRENYPPICEKLLQCGGFHARGYHNHQVWETNPLKVCYNYDKFLRSKWVIDADFHTLHE